MKNNGATLLEVLVAILIVGIISGVVLSTMSSTFNMNQDAERRTEAAFIAQDKMDTLKLLDPSALPMSGSEETTTDVNGRSYSVTVLYCVTDAYCKNNNRDVVIEIRGGGKLMFSGETVLTQVQVSQ